MSSSPVQSSPMDCPVLAVSHQYHCDVYFSITRIGSPIPSAYGVLLSVPVIDTSSWTCPLDCQLTRRHLSIRIVLPLELLLHTRRLLLQNQNLCSHVLDHNFIVIEHVARTSQRNSKHLELVSGSFNKFQNKMKISLHKTLNHVLISTEFRLLL